MSASSRVPFEEGLLSGQLALGYQFEPSDWRARWLTPERLAEAARHAEALKKFLQPDHPTLPALALEFCLSHPAVSTVIPGMRCVEHVEANCTVSDGVLLSPQELEALKAHAWVHGWDIPGASKSNQTRQASSWRVRPWGTPARGRRRYSDAILTT